MTDRMRHPRPFVAVVAALLLLVACGGGGGDDGGGAAPGGGGTATTLPPFAPLTGLPLTDQARLARPALMVKIENAPASRPQSGLDSADIVYEEIVEGGITRFLAVFHSTDADRVGPVRSLRPTDPDIIAAFGGLFAYSGGIPNFIEVLRRTPGITDIGVDVLDEGPDKPYTRRAGRAAPNNLYTSTARLYARGPTAGNRPPDRFNEFLPEGQAFTAGGAAPAAGISLTVGITPVLYEYDAVSKTYRRAGLVEGSGTVAPTNVIVQFTSYADTDETDLTGATVEKATTLGSGDALVLSGGVAVRGKWSRDSATSYTTYMDASGAPIRLAAGRTWIALARNGAQFTLR
ncbi:MAG TPA: DUF3048 domain-containing protein [Acidimicrobiales bacterium]|nr:DUF3048 domain-containing protein [Acidimicrobiales bacterium]